MPPQSFSLFEYHCFNANELIRELLSEIANDPGVFIIIASRDPLDRWAASFNWDYHNVILSTPEPSRKFMRMIKSFPKVQNLAKAIAANDRKAYGFGKLEHMGLGPSWYLPLSLIDSLPTDRTYYIRLENIQQDLPSMVEDIASRMSLENTQILKHIPLTKANYKEAYPAKTFGHLNDLSRSETER